MLVNVNCSPECCLNSNVGSGVNAFPEYPMNPSPIVKIVFPFESLKSRLSNVNSEATEVGELKTTSTSYVYASDNGLVNTNIFSFPISPSVI